MGRLTPRLALSLTLLILGLLLGGCGDANTSARGSHAASATGVLPTASSTGRVIPPGAPLRTPVAANGTLGLAVDGNQGVWFVDDAGDLERYVPNQPLRRVSLDPGAQARTLRSAPDGSIWFAEPGRGALAHLASDGQVVTFAVNGGEFQPNWGVAVGPDGSVWYDAAHGVARRRPDGSTTSYAVQDNGAITVDSHGNAWVPGASIEITRISDGGQVSEFKFENGIEQVAEAADGNMWFVDVRGAQIPRVGYLDASGRPTFFDAINATGGSFPNSIVRGPDGAVWFFTQDRRLVRIASASDVTVFTLPWSDASTGAFAILPGNRVVIVGRGEVLDFKAGNGTRVAGAGAIPTPTPHIPKDAAEAAAYAAAQAEAGATQRVELAGGTEGDRAAEFTYNVGRGPGYILIVYVVEDGTAWRKFDSFGTQNLQPPGPGVKEVLQFTSGCLNVHDAPSASSRVLDCLPSGTAIEIDGTPTYADAVIWWHLAGRGWAVHQFLYCNEWMYKQRPGC